MGSNIIEIEGLSVAYGDKTVLHDVSLNIGEKDFLGVIGPNGGGKTTLIKTIIGLNRPSAGEISFYRGGQKTDSLNIGYLPQYNVIDKKFPISVFEVVLSGLLKEKRLIGGYSRQQKQRAMQVVAEMGLEGLEQRPIGSLSGGQMQRALLGRAIVSRPEVVILDEPSTYIDRYHETKLYELLQKINQSSTVILVSHDIGTVLQQVKTIACVNGTLHFHPAQEVNEEWIVKNFHCPIEILGHGDMPHRIVRSHDGHEH